MSKKTNYADQYHNHLDLIQGVIENICRRHHLSKEMGEDFTSVVNLKLLEDNFAVLRKFKGNSSLRTYLITVVHRFYQDYRNKTWGKWRPSAAAQRLGGTALLLERLISRDGYCLKEAIEIMRTNHSVTLSSAQIHDLTRRLPLRHGRSFTSEEALANIPAKDPDGMDLLEEHEASVARQRTEEAMLTALGNLPAEDRLCLKLRFYQNMTVAQIAERLHKRPKKLYRHFEKMLAGLKKKLMSQGIMEKDIKELWDGRP